MTDALATVTALRPRSIPEDQMSTIQHALGALRELDGDLTRIGAALDRVLGGDEPNGHREHEGDLLVGLLGFAEVLLQDLSDERGQTRGDLLGAYAELNGGPSA